MNQQNKEHIILGRVNYKDNDNPMLTEEAFYPPEDKRKFNSSVRNVYKGNCFDSFLKEFYDMYEEEIYDDYF